MLHCPSRLRWRQFLFPDLMAEKSEEKMRAEKRDKKEKRYRIMCVRYGIKKEEEMRHKHHTSYFINTFDASNIIHHTSSYTIHHTSQYISYIYKELTTGAIRHPTIRAIFFAVKEIQRVLVGTPPARHCFEICDLRVRLHRA